MELIDLTDLSDDQLVTLTAACCAEAVRRGTATEEAVRAEMLSALERRQIHEQFGSLETRRLRQLEIARAAEAAREEAQQAEAARQAESVAAVERTRLEAQAQFAREWQELLGRGWTVTVWQSGADRTDRRVYGDQAGGGRVVFKRGKLSAQRCGVTPSMRPQVAGFCARALAAWPRITLTIDDLAQLAQSNTSAPTGGTP